MICRCSILLVLAWGAGCAAPLGLGRPATVIEPGHVRASLDVGVRTSPGASEVQDAATRQVRARSGQACGNGDASERCVDDSTRRAMVRGAAAGILSTPQTADVGLTVRYGVVPGIDAGLRLGSNAVRAEVAHQLYGDPLNSVDSGLTALLGVGLSHQLVVADQPLGLLGIRGTGRDDVDLFALLGYRYDRKAYLSVGARYIASSLRGELVERVPSADPGGATAEVALRDTHISGLGHHIGLVASAYAGLGAVYFGVELAGGLDFTRVRALGEETWVSAASYRPGLVIFLEI